jgi:hypothetical protein
MIIRFLWNEGIDAHKMTHRSQAQFDKHTDLLRTVRFWIAEVRTGRQDLHDEIRTAKSPLDDLDAKIMAMFAKSPFESIWSIAETLYVAHSTVLLH